VVDRDSNITKTCRTIVADVALQGDDSGIISRSGRKVRRGPR
jgi:hypothetical protein